jgi:hypothetical protein
MNFVVKNPGPWECLGTCHEGSMLLSAPQKYVRQTREPDSATGERIFRPMALTRFDKLEEVYPR